MKNKNIKEFRQLAESYAAFNMEQYNESMKELDLVYVKHVALQRSLNNFSIASRPVHFRFGINDSNRCILCIAVEHHCSLCVWNNDGAYKFNVCLDTPFYKAILKDARNAQETIDLVNARGKVMLNLLKTIEEE